MRAGPGVTPGHVSAIWFYLEDYASQHPDRGSIAGFDPELLAAAYDWDLELITRVEKALRAKGLIEGNRLTAWTRRQPKREDLSTERVRRFRESRTATESNETKHDETKGNATKRNETPDKIRTEKMIEEEDKQKAVDKSTGDQPRASIPLDQNGADPIPQDLGALIAGPIREFFWLGNKPPKESGGWSMGREISTARQLIERSGITPEELVGAIQVVRDVTSTFEGDEQITLKIFNVQDRMDRLNECVGFWHKREQKKRNGGARRSLQPLTAEEVRDATR